MTMILFIVITALLCLLLLGIDSFRQVKQRKETDTPHEKMPLDSSKSTSILGKSHYQLSQLLPNDVTSLKTEADMKDNTKEESTFAGSSLETEHDDPEEIDVDVPPLEKEEPDEDDFIEEEEITGLFGPDAEIASGVSVDDMLKADKVISDVQASVQDEEEAGQILYQNRKTNIVKQIASNSSVRIERIRDLMYIHEKKYGIVETDIPTNKDLENFDINNFIR